MAIVNPTPPTTPPPIPQRADRSTFSARVDAGFTWFVTLISEVYSLAQNAFNNATESAASAGAASTSAGIATTQATNASNSAIAAAATAGAALWVSGTSYTAYTSNVISPANGKTYRRLITGAGTTDPSLDATNWAGLSGEVSGLKLIATLTPTAAANVDALTVFTSTYDDYEIIADGILPFSNDALYIRFAVAGAVDSALNYIEVPSMGTSSTDVNRLQLTIGHSSTGKGANLELMVQNCNSTTSIKSVRILSLTEGASTFYSIARHGTHKPNNAISGIRFFWGSGSNFAAQGSIRIYGVLK
jgi:hypothetical protein